MWKAVVGLSWVCTVGCLPSGASAEKEGGLIISDPALRKLVADTQDAVLLVYAPEDCFSCFGALDEWLAWRVLDGGNVHLILSREPTPAERRSLLLAGLREAAVLRQFAPNRTPLHLRVVHGKLRQAEFGGRSGSSMLDELRETAGRRGPFQGGS